MNRLEHLRLYRSRLVNEVNAIVDEHLEAGAPAENYLPMYHQVQIMQQRVRLMHVEIDKLMAIELGCKDAQPEVQFA